MITGRIIIQSVPVLYRNLRQVFTVLASRAIEKRVPKSFSHGSLGVHGESCKAHGFYSLELVSASFFP